MSNLTFRLMILVLIILVIYTSPLVASGYYYNNLDIGEHISNLNQNLNLDYRGGINNYNYYLNLTLDKRNTIIEGDWLKSDWDYSDFLLGLSKREDKLELGMTDSGSFSSFVSGGSLVGAYLKKGKYDIWYGYISGEDSGFSSSSDKQIGFSYKEGSRKIGYQSCQIFEEDNHYLSYYDNYIWSNYYLNLDTALGADLDDDLVGEALNLNLSSNLGEVNYNFKISYKSANFEAINSAFNKGYGQYNLSLRGYRQLGAYLLQSKVGYGEDNLNREGDDFSRDYSTTWQVDYYTDVGSTYSLVLDYDWDNEYQTAGEIKTDFDTDVSLRLGYENMDWDCNLNLSEDKSRNLIEDNQEVEKEVVISIGYSPVEDYEIDGAYYFNWDDNNREEYFNFDFDYQNNSFKKLSYNLDMFLNNKDGMKFEMNQQFGYNLTSQHRLGLELSLNKYLDYGDWNKGLNCSYSYHF